MAADLTDRPHDLVVFGASGFVGRLTAAYLARSAPAGLRVALAGRSRERLEAVRETLPDAARAWPVLLADSSDTAALDALAGSARVVVSTVGPYARYGLPLVQACARAGTSYADLTGEVLFVRDSIDTAHAAASASGARVVHACGFDAVPSELGVLLAAQQARADGEGTLVRATLLLVSARGGFSGGTVDSLRNQVDTARADPALRRVLADPYALSPDRAAEPDLGPQRDAFLARRDPDLGGRWVAPFVMAPFNTRVVRRSNALQGWAYGRGLRYAEVFGVGRTPVAPLLAAGIGAGSAALAAGLALGPARAVLDRVLPSPGEGPDERARDGGHFHTATTAVTASGAVYRTTVRAKGDPGYAATSVMLGESALALAGPADALPDAAGVLTPATAVGAVLAERLRAAGFAIEVARVA